MHGYHHSGRAAAIVADLDAPVLSRPPKRRPREQGWRYRAPRIGVSLLVGEGPV